MRLTAFTDFGLRALMMMASDTSRSWSTAEIATKFDISRDHLKKIIATLASAGIVKTRKGSGGGAELAVDIHNIRIGEVVRLLERDHALVECFAKDGGACNITPVCQLRGFLGQAEQAFLATLDGYTLADCALSPQSNPILKG